MFYKRMEDGFLVRLERGEELMAALRSLLERERIGSGSVTGLGAVSGARLGFYRLEEKSYVERRFEGEFEICALVGSLSWHQGAPFPHVHLVLGDSEFRTFGGHCFEATAAATIELRIRSEAARVNREQDDRIGLHLMALPRSCPIGP